MRVRVRVRVRVKVKVRVRARVKARVYAYPHTYLRIEWSALGARVVEDFKHVARALLREGKARKGRAYIFFFSK